MLLQDFLLVLHPTECTKKGAVHYLYYFNSNNIDKGQRKTTDTEKQCCPWLILFI